MAGIGGMITIVTATIGFIAAGTVMEIVAGIVDNDPRHPASGCEWFRIVDKIGRLGGEAPDADGVTSRA